MSTNPDLCTEIYEELGLSQEEESLFLDWVIAFYEKGDTKALVEKAHREAPKALDAIRRFLRSLTG